MKSLVPLALHGKAEGGYSKYTLTVHQNNHALAVSSANSPAHSQPCAKKIRASFVSDSFEML